MEDSCDLYVMKEGKVSGPYSLAELISWVLDGRASPTLEVCVGGTDNWIPLGELAPGPVAAAASGLIAKQKTIAGRMRLGLGIASGVVLAALIWSLFVTFEGRRAKYELVGTASATAEKLAELEDAKSKARAASGEASSFESKARRSEADAKAARETATSAEQRLAQKDRELAAKVAEVESQTRRIKKLEGLAVSYADRLVSVSELLQKTAEVPLSVSISVHGDDDGPLSFDTEGIKAMIQNEFVRSGFKIAPSKSTVFDSLVVVAEMDQLEITKNVQAAYRLDMACLSKCGRGDQLAVHNAFQAGTFGFAGTGSNYRTTIREFFVGTTARCLAELRRLKDQAGNSIFAGPPHELYKDLIDEGVPLVTASQAKSPVPDSSGSGVVIASRPLVLTNRHVVDEGKRLVLYFPGHFQGMEGVVLFSDSAFDLAVVGLKERLSTFEHVVLPPFAADDELTTGSEVFSLGYPLANVLGNEVKYSAGTVSSLTGMQGSTDRFQLSVPTQPGNSGGPVFLKTGSICGVMVSTLNPFRIVQEAGTLPQNVNYAVHPKAIRSFLLAKGLWSEVEADKHQKVDVEKAKRFAVRIETFAQ